MANSNPLADSAYNYIEHYNDLIKKATRRLNQAGQDLATANDTLANDESRYAYLEDLVKRLQQTDTSYENIAEIITRAKKLSGIIMTNVGFVTEAIQGLLCSVRFISQATDALKSKIDAFKQQLNNLDKNNGLYKKLLELEEKNNDAILANKEAIKKCLETLKEIYIIHANLLGKTMNLGKEIAEYKDKHIIFYGKKGVTESCGSVKIFDPEYCSDDMESLVSHFVKLQKLLNEDKAYRVDKLTTDERKAVPCTDLNEKPKATFPLKEDDFFSVINAEKGNADTARKKSKDAAQKALSNRDGVQAELAGYQAALKAAEDARKVTTG